MSDPKPRRMVARTITCEWCAAGATYRICASKGYRRYSCDAHYEKTRRLVVLDGRDIDPIVLTHSSLPFTTQVLE
jgi:cytidylate kinase